MAKNSCQTQHNLNQNEIGCWGLTTFPELGNQLSAAGQGLLPAPPRPSWSRQRSGGEGGPQKEQRFSLTSDQLQVRGCGPTTTNFNVPQLFDWEKEGLY